MTGLPAGPQDKWHTLCMPLLQALLLIYRHVSPTKYMRKKLYLLPFCLAQCGLTDYIQSIFIEWVSKWQPQTGIWHNMYYWVLSKWTKYTERASDHFSTLLSVGVLWELKNMWENENPALQRALPMQISLNSKWLHWFLTTVVMAEIEWKILLSSLYA